MQQRGDAGLRQAGQFGQRRIEQFEIARQQRAQDQARGELAGGAQMLHQALHVLAARTRRDVHGRALARFAGEPPCPVRAQPVLGDDELRQRVGEFRDQRHAGGGRQAFQHQHRFTDRGEMAVTLDDAVPRERRQLGIGVLDQFERGGGRADFGDRGGYRRRQVDPAGDRALRLAVAGRDDVDEIGIDQKRGMFEHRQRDRRLVERERLHDRGAALPRCARTPAPWPGAPAGTDRRAASTARLRRRRDRPRKGLKSTRPAPKTASPLPARLPERFVSN